MKEYIILVIIGFILFVFGCSLNPVLDAKGVNLSDANVIVDIYPAYQTDSLFYYVTNIRPNYSTVEEIVNNSNLTFGINIVTTLTAPSYLYNLHKLDWMIGVMDRDYTDETCFEARIPAKKNTFNYFDINSANLITKDLKFFVTNVEKDKAYYIIVFALDGKTNLMSGYGELFITN
jgi:hypothetical protein